MAKRPTGTVTFLFTDIEGSTRLWEQHPVTMQSAVAQHDTILHGAVEERGGYVVKTTGDGLFAAFAVADHALAAALAAQHALVAATWNDTGPLRVRMGLHTGPAQERDGDYFGPALNRTARLMAVGHGGQILLSLPTYELVRDHLPEGVTLRDLGEQRLKDLTRPEHVYQIVAADLPGDFPPLKTLDVRPNNLPAQPTAFIGREAELSVVKKLLLRDDARLVTLTGPGGTGKTRLGLQVAADLMDQFEDGVYFVDLAPITTPSLVVPSVAQALGVRDQGAQPLLDTLKDYLREKQMLLVFDNLEQVVAAAPLVADLLAVAPRLKALVTSRIVLHLRGEQEFSVPPLPVPDPRRLPQLSELSQYAAVELFVQRAVNVKPDFEVTDDNAAAVAEICYRLDGLPLAIELAAARIKLFPPQTLLQRLTRRLKVLTGGSRDLPARQQTLRDAITWSYDLLSASERILFHRLAVFIGGFTLDAAEAVCNASDDLDIDVLDGIASLVDKSLLRQQEQADGEPRFVMLETLREYAAERLDASGEAEAVRRAHVQYYLAWVEDAEPRLKGHDQIVWAKRLEADNDNLRTAIAWAVQKSEAEIALRLTGALSWFWQLGSRLSEGCSWIEQAWASSRAVPPSQARAKALFGLGVLATWQGDWTTARSALEAGVADARAVDDRRYLALTLSGLAQAIAMQGAPDDTRLLAEESLALARSLGDRWVLAEVLNQLGARALFLGEYDAVPGLAQESVRLFEAVGDRRGISSSLGPLGWATMAQGDYETARIANEKSLVAARALGYRIGEAYNLAALGDIARIRGDYAAAGSYYEESLVLCRDLGLKRDIPALLHNLGYVALAHGDTARAYELQRQSLSLHQEAGNNVGILEALDGLAAVARTTGDATRAARLLGAVEALHESGGTTMWPAERVEYDRQVAALRAELDPATFERAWLEGRAMTLDQAVAHALH